MKDHEIEAYVMEQSSCMGMDDPTITYRKMKHYYGVAHPWSWSVSLNRTWVHKANDVLVKDVIIHELAHLKEYWIYGGCSHSKKFKAICEQYGAHGSGCFKKVHQRELIAASKRETK